MFFTEGGSHRSACVFTVEDKPAMEGLSGSYLFVVSRRLLLEFAIFAELHILLVAHGA
jgi:hypothetical protein